MLKRVKSFSQSPNDNAITVLKERGQPVDRYAVNRLDAR